MSCTCKPMPHIEECSWCLNQQIEKLEGKMKTAKDALTFILDKATYAPTMRVQAYDALKKLKE